jgi:hypothetical protein
MPSVAEFLCRESAMRDATRMATSQQANQNVLPRMTHAIMMHSLLTLFDYLLFVCL